MTREELVDKMLDAQDESNRSDVWRTYCPEDKRRFRLAMSAALRVAVKELLAEPTKGEIEVINASTLDEGPKWAKRWIQYRRAKLEPKTPEERVTLSAGCGDFESWSVQLDGKTKVTFGGSKEDAEIYRKGLIADLKEKGE